jgi:hypothetical protein
MCSSFKEVVVHTNRSPSEIVTPYSPAELELAEAAVEEPLLRKINPAILYLQAEMSRDCRGKHINRDIIDPREIAHECFCEAEDHGATVELREIKDSPTLTVHIPFALLIESTSLPRDPYDSIATLGAKTPVGMRLAWQLRTLRGHEGVSFSTYSMAIKPARALPIEPNIDAIEDALRLAGCPHLQIRDNIRSKVPVGFVRALMHQGE